MGEAGDAGEALHMVERRAPDIVVVDVAMLGTVGVDAIAEMRQVRPGVRILMLSMQDDPIYV